MQVEVNAKYVLVNETPLLNFQGMEYLIYYKFTANVDDALTLHMLKNKVSLSAITKEGKIVQVVGCPTDQLSLYILVR
jgi:hypothetical protein